MAAFCWPSTSHLDPIEEAKVNITEVPRSLSPCGLLLLGFLHLVLRTLGQALMARTPVARNGDTFASQFIQLPVPSLTIAQVPKGGPLDNFARKNPSSRWTSEWARDSNDLRVADTR